MGASGPPEPGAAAPRSSIHGEGRGRADEAQPPIHEEAVKNAAGPRAAAADIPGRQRATPDRQAAVTAATRSGPSRCLRRKHEERVGAAPPGGGMRLGGLRAHGQFLKRACLAATGKVPAAGSGVVPEDAIGDGAVVGPALDMTVDEGDDIAGVVSPWPCQAVVVGP